MNDFLKFWSRIRSFDLKRKIEEELSECAHLEWKPYVYWRRKAYRGNCIQINKEGIRWTYAPEDATKTIWMFGSSTLWGSYVSVDATIPAIITNELLFRGTKVAIINYAESSYVSTQDLISLMLELRAGKKPDVVIFYNGLNDVLSAIKSGIAGEPWQEKYRRKEFNLTHPKQVVRLTGIWLDSMARKLKMKGDAFYHRTPTLSLIWNTVALYQANMDMAYALSKHYGFKLIVYWEPTIFEKILKPDEEKLIDQLPTYYSMAFREAAIHVCKQMHPYFKSLSRIFDDRKETLYRDWIHYEEDGNRIAAKEITNDLQKLFRADQGDQETEPPFRNLA